MARAFVAAGGWEERLEQLEREAGRQQQQVLLEVEKLKLRCLGAYGEGHGMSAVGRRNVRRCLYGSWPH